MTEEPVMQTIPQITPSGRAVTPDPRAGLINPMQQSGGAAAAAEQSRSIAEVQASMAIAKQFPRDAILAMQRIEQACTRPGLAEVAVYTYRRGGQEVTGPSIRLAEVLAQCWGNLQFGVRELANHNGWSTCEAFAWDVETNVRQVKVFEVEHARYTKRGRQDLEDSRDIYELVANQGARRLRACLLGVIPGDLVEFALSRCDETLRTKLQITPEKIKRMVAAYEELGVTKKQLADKLGHGLESMRPAELARLGRIYSSIQDGYTTVAEEFPSDFKPPEDERQPDEQPARTTWEQPAFDAQLPAWTKVIDSGMRTPDQVIAMARSKADLTPEQEKTIRQLATASQEQ
jgi:hypothetical protein